APVLHQKPNYIFYQSHPEFVDKVNSEVNRRLEKSSDAELSKENNEGDGDGDDGGAEEDQEGEEVQPPKKGAMLRLRNQVARELWEAEPEEVKARLNEEREADLQDRKKARSALHNGANLRDSELVSVRRENFVRLVQPLVDAIGAMTNSKVVVLSGNIDDNGSGADPDQDQNQLWLSHVESGDTGGRNPRTFSQLNPADFKDKFAKTFVEFLKVARRIEMGLPETQASDPFQNLITFPNEPNAPAPTSSLNAKSSTRTQRKPSKRKGKARALSVTEESMASGEDTASEEDQPSPSQRSVNRSSASPSRHMNANERKRLPGTKSLCGRWVWTSPSSLHPSVPPNKGSS
ncbi:hypothetical protein F5878DRAFT_668132, partial [Lentinula raphanica]